MNRHDSTANRLQERNTRTILFLTGLLFCALLLIHAFNTKQYTQTLLALGITFFFLVTSKYWMILKDRGIPVLTFHSISNDDRPFPWPYLRLSVDTFQRMIQLLFKRGYQTVSLSDVASHMKGDKKLKAKSIALTFDDGYLDNWVAVYPILKQHGFSGTVFVPTDFIDHDGGIRHTLDDLETKNISSEQLEWKGYLSAQELRRMDREGVLYIESHTASHTWLYKHDQVRGFLSPKNKMIPWIFWNMFPQYKHAWQKYLPLKEKKLLGNPIFDFSRAHLVEKAFVPDKKIIEELQATLQTSNNPDTQAEKSLHSILRNRQEQPSNAFPGHWENSHEALERLNREFTGSKNILEKILSKKIKHLCWPGDIFTEKLFSQAIENHGYQTVTGGQGRNTVKNNSHIISRIYVKHTYSPFSFRSLNLLLFYSEIKVFEGNLYFFPLCMIFNQLNKITKRVFRDDLKAVSS